MKKIMILGCLLAASVAAFGATGVTPSPHGLTVTWVLSTTPGVTSQIICRGTTSGAEDCANPVATLSATATAVNDLTGAGGTTYYYIQESCIGTICSGPSNEGSAVYPIVPAPGSSLSVKPQ